MGCPWNPQDPCVKLFLLFIYCLATSLVTITYENVINCLFPLIIYQYNYEKGLCVFNATMFRNMWAISWDHFGWCVTVETIDLLQVTDNLCYFTLSRAEIKLICHGLFCVPWVQLRWKVIVHFVDICGIDDHHCLNFPFKLTNLAVIGTDTIGRYSSNNQHLNLFIVFDR
jgi:hypothetical protein